MVPVALLTKFAPVLGGLVWEVIVGLVRGMFRLTVPSYFIHILTLFLACVAL